MESIHRKINDLHLGIVCPMANERDTAAKFITMVLEECKGFRDVTFFAVIDNVSRDGTLDLLRNLAGRIPELRVVWSPENRCIVDAYVRGYMDACAASCDWILEIDAGFSHDPREIPQFFNEMAKGYDCVFGSRFCRGGAMLESPLVRRFISRGGTILVNLLIGTKLKDMTSGFELFSRSALENVLKKGIHSKGHFFQTEIKVYCKKMRIVEVPIHYRSPSVSVTSAILVDAFINLFRLFRLHLSGEI